MNQKATNLLAAPIARITAVIVGPLIFLPVLRKRFCCETAVQHLKAQSGTCQVKAVEKERIAVDQAPKARGQDMGGVHSLVAENFSLTHGGPLHRILFRWDGSRPEHYRVLRRALFGILVTWLPLFVLSLVQGVGYQAHVGTPFLRDIAVNVRFLVALPILILAESRIDERWRTLVLQFLRSGLVQEAELPSFEAVIGKITRLRDRVLPEAVMLALAYVPSVFSASTELLMSDSNWHFLGAPSGEVSLAGWWFRLVSQPFFRFLLLRWMWRMILWALFLWRASRINLYLIATHTDMAAGLGFLSEGQKVFSPIVFAGGAVIAAQIGNAIAYKGATLSSLKLLMIAYGVLAILLLVVPLLVLLPVLRKVKRKALLEYGALVASHDQLFDTKWIRGEQASEDVILGNPDSSSLADLGGSFAVVREMRLVPIDKPTLITLAVSAALPMVPVVLIATPADELVRAVLKLLA